jgi:hypothetical protein
MITNRDRRLEVEYAAVIEAAVRANVQPRRD